MHRFVLATCFVLAMLTAPSAHAGLFGTSPDKAARQAAEQRLPAVTLWIDATWGFRNQGAANDLSRAHQAFAAQGYRVVDVAPYIENGDLQGFFVTYQKQ